MSELLQRTLAWKMVICKGAILVFINMGTVINAAMNNWTREYVDSIGWWGWLNLCVSAAVAGGNTLYAYLDKTFHIEGNEVSLSNIRTEAKALEVAKTEAKVEAKKEDEKNNNI